MTDFMKWLYTAYIKPQLDEAPQDGYEMWLSLMDSLLTAELREAYNKNLEFTAIHAFLLGLRTGEGLSPLTPR
ncbi:hypothetical protein [uncultured Dysosmobacter sp.]|uniref:hypothetical protein n=1 Tax=uncultured Dysosmobacter sp. TaxID=2591384 RepID=UPI002626F578|nr:hypothetical protein [uncultured Dysosmobacter sp.]